MQGFPCRISGRSVAPFAPSVLPPLWMPLKKGETGDLTAFTIELAELRSDIADPYHLMPYLALQMA